MIPKIIHYCWFGGKEKPELVKKCIASWKKFCPDYELQEWNEDSFEVSSVPSYVKEAYASKKWAFVSDYVRLWALYEYGGIYMDTDVEIVKSLDGLLSDKGFLGFESKTYLATCVIGAEKELPLIKELVADYNNRHFVKGNGEFDFTTNVETVTDILKRSGFRADGLWQERDGFVLYPSDYFCPFDDATGRLNKTENTVAIHWFNKSWIPADKRLRSKITRIFHRIFGVNCFKIFKRADKKERLNKEGKK